jgi:hypothetical protein
MFQNVNITNPNQSEITWKGLKLTFEMRFKGEIGR